MGREPNCALVRERVVGSACMAIIISPRTDMPFDPHQKSKPLSDRRVRNNGYVVLFAAQLAGVALMAAFVRPIGIVHLVILAPLGLLFLWRLIAELRKR